MIMALIALWCVPSGGAQTPGVLASLSVTPDGVRAQGLASVSGADGVTTAAVRGGSHALATAPGATPASQYLYFKVDRAIAREATGPLYVVVEYFDAASTGAVGLQYDSAAGDDIGARYREADDLAGGYLAGTRSWRRAAYLLAQPKFAGRQNLGADFRLSGANLAVRAVVLTRTRPSDWEAMDRIDIASVKPLVRPGPGTQLIIGGFDPARREDGPRLARALQAAAPGLRAIGVTSHEVYVRWNLCEPREGEYDWSLYDRYVDVYKRTGLKWVPFLICGSPYSLPDWYYKKPGSQGYVCLEHGQESDVQSLWNPTLRKHLARFIKAFCEHYRDSGVIESILLGVTGNYGEAIYPATGNDWTADVHGPYHTHPGFWAGDPFAIESFRSFLITKYGGQARFRDAWGEKSGGINEARPFLKQNAPNERAWLDMVEWYIGSMTDYARFWLESVRQSYPQGGVYLCTGGHAPAEHGADFGDQCKVAAKYGAGVRITNEGSDYAANFSLTRWVASAGRQYGAYFSFEPAGEVNPAGVIARIYNAAASGARGLHYYQPNLYGSEEAHDNFVKWGSFWTRRDPIVEIGVYYPETHIRLNTNDFLPIAQRLRRSFDFAYVSDQQILDGGLARVKALVITEGYVSEARVWSAVSSWVDRGGVVVLATGGGQPRTVEGDPAVIERLLRPTTGDRKGLVIRAPGRGADADFAMAACDALLRVPSLQPVTRRMLQLQKVAAGAFATCVGPAELLWLNPTDRAIDAGGTNLPAHSIVSVRTE
jgi:hypothetical protein